MGAAFDGHETPFLADTATQIDALLNRFNTMLSALSTSFLQPPHANAGEV